jgi:Protein of unknown function (DUF3311)
MAHDAPGEERFARQDVPPDRATTGPATSRRGVATRHRNHGWYWLFVLPFVFTLLPWIYNTDSPELFGMPFFYWYQMAWVPITVILTIVVYIKTKGA